MSPEAIPGWSVEIVIPVLDEEESIALVLDSLPRQYFDGITVADNGSTDRTAEIARDRGVTVVEAPRKGYGSACMVALASLPTAADPSREVVVFIDGDFSDYGEDLPDLLAPIVDGDFEMVIGSRVNPRCLPGALPPQARIGNALAVFLIDTLFGVRYSDLGPFRAIRRDALDRLQMADPDFGWTVEMQMKAAHLRIPSTEVPVGYRKRVGRSKITGTVRGTFLAGYKILVTILILGYKARFSRDRTSSGNVATFRPHK